MKLTLDLKTWRCGNDTETASNRLGEGNTSLLNDIGEMCCLGQFAKQCGLKDDDIIDRADPREISAAFIPKLRPFTKMAKVKGNKKLQQINTKLSSDLITINDDEDTTVLEKIKKMRTRLARNKHTLVVKNYKDAGFKRSEVNK